MITVDELKEALKTVVDPEIGLSIVDLGLVYDVALDAKKCHIKMTLTSQGCPYGPQMLMATKHVAQKATGLKPDEVNVEVVWNPPWDPRTMASDDAKFMLGLL
jgi:metal-sulfur cluster biosynthetic enzyme